MITRYYIREVGKKKYYYYLFHGSEGFIKELEDAYTFNSKNDAITFLNREGENSIFEGKVVEIVKHFCF